MRQEQARPILEALKPWLERQLGAVSRKAAIAEAIRYVLTRWDGLVRFVEDGRIELDSNVVERTMRPIALGRKNHLFAGSDGGGAHWAAIASLGDCPKFRVRAMTKGRKEPSHGTTQSTGDPG
jgi:hypothetical protein